MKMYGKNVKILKSSISIATFSELVMDIIARYKRLNIWNKIGFWGAVSSIVGILIAIVFFCVSQGGTYEIRGDLSQIVEMLREELSVKNEQVVFLQRQVTRLGALTPSERARRLAKQVPDDARPYALALKAIAQKRFEDAHRFLDEAQEQKETELAEIYRARGETEFYAGNYVNAEGWYKKAIYLAPDDHVTCLEASIVFFYNAKYEDAEPLMRRTLEIDERSYGEDHPNFARDLNNLAELLRKTNRFDEAEPMYRRALAIDENFFGLDHPKVAVALNNLAELLRDTLRSAKAEPMYRRALMIHEKSFGPDHPNVAICLNNLGELLRDTSRFEEAEPMYRRALQIDEKSFGPEHPNVARGLNNLALLLASTNRLADAEPLMRRALNILENSLGPDHSKTQKVRKNLELLK